MAEAVDECHDSSVRPKLQLDSSAHPVTACKPVENQEDNESNISSETEGPDTHSMVSSSGETGGADSDSLPR